MSRANPKDVQSLREEFIRAIDSSQNKTEKIKLIAEDLFSLGLTVYSRDFSFKSLIYNSFSTSQLDSSISLHPEQIKALNLIEANEGLIFSAPTSFGKTFVVFEYIARKKPNNVVLVVPTLALVDEYKRRIIKKYKDVFSEYKVYSSVSEDGEYDFTKKNIFILTHDRIVDKSSYQSIKEIDLLVVDEVYKLQKNISDDRVLVLNLAYYHLANIAKKHVLLAPFISGVENMSSLSKKPAFYKTDYSPVVNEVKTYEVMSEEDRVLKALEILKQIPNNEQTMIYFPTITSLGAFVEENLNEISFSISDDQITNFIDWAKTEIHEKWYLIKAMEKGFLVHNGQLPVGIRMFQLYLYENKENFNKLMCTSTLLEGINTSAKHIIITKPSPYGKGSKFAAFDFFNLVGRSGRLFEHYLGIAHYIKSPTDMEYRKEDAIKDIQFEVTDESEDIDIHKNNYTENEEYKAFIKKLGIDNEEYKEKLGTKFRFKTVLDLYNHYQEHKEGLFKEMDKLIENDQLGRLFLIQKLYEIFEGNGNLFYCGIINNLLNQNRLSVRAITEKMRQVPAFKDMDLNYLITTILRIKSSYIEHQFYTKLLAILFFMEKENIDKEYFKVIDKRIRRSINVLYYIESMHRKMLLDLGIYETDIEEIIKVIGEEFKDVTEMVSLLRQNQHKLNKISIISKFVINSLIN